MRVINVVLPSSHEIIPVGDKHLGVSSSHMEGIEELYDYILAKKNRYHVDLGDRIEAITVDDKRFMVDKSGEVPIPLIQAEKAVKQDERVANRMLAMLIGNHELALRKFGNLTEWMASDLSRRIGKEIPYATYTCVIKVHDKHGLLYRLWLSHGFGTFSSNAKDYEQRLGNYKALLKNRLRYKADDCVVMGMGHTHKLFVVEPTNQLSMSYNGDKQSQRYLEWNGDNSLPISPDVRWYFSAGCFLQTYSEGVGYAEVKGYDPTELGYCIIQVHDRKVVGIKKIVV